MTREEAIELLDILPLFNECDSSNFPYTCAECGDAFLLAMEALKQPEVVRCKDCKWRGNKKKCIVAFVADKQEFPLFFYDNRGNWFCADGERKEVK